MKLYSVSEINYCKFQGSPNYVTSTQKKQLFNYVKEFAIRNTMIKKRYLRNRIKTLNLC